MPNFVATEGDNKDGTVDSDVVHYEGEDTDWRDGSVKFLEILGLSTHVKVIYCEPNNVVADGLGVCDFEHVLQSFEELLKFC